MSLSTSTALLWPVVLPLLVSGVIAAAEPRRPALAYPKPPVSGAVDRYHGLLVPDPYRKLEEPDAPETRAWIEAENRITEPYLAAIPEREGIQERLTRLWNFERTSPPFQEGGRYFYTKNDGLQNQAVLYVVPKLGGVPRVLLDPNGLSADGTVALAGFAVSRDGKRLAYGTASAGSDWNEWRVRDVDTGQDLPDHLRWIKFSSAAWAADGSGFYYGRYDAPEPGAEMEALNKDQKLCFHRLGTAQSEDVIVYQRPDQPEWGFAPQVTDDGRYLVVSVWHGTDRRNRLYVKQLEVKDLEAGGGFLKLLDDFDAAYSFVDNDGPVFYVRTDKDAPRGRLVAVDLREAGSKAPRLREVIPQGEDVLESVGLVADRFVAVVLKDATERARIHALDGRLEKEIELPTLGAVGGFYGKRKDRETFFSFTSFTYPTTVYRYDFDTGRAEEFRKPSVDFDPSRYETRQVFYTSKDGAKVPLFLVHRKGLKQNGKNPTYLYGYGGFNVSMTPAFSVKNLLWLEMGGLYAQACLRGGGEYGEAWHEAGMLGKKQNTFDDFAAAARWLVVNRYTSSRRLAIGGGSNGGLLVGATLNQNPTLFGAAVPAVGVMDMLRFHRFTIGWAWVSEYGSSADPEQLKWLMAYSPLHNVRKGAKYPPVLITTADHDDRVVPAHSFKYAAALQAAQGGSAPVLIRIETKAGHGAGKPTNKLIEEAADVLAFLSKSLGGLTAPPSRKEAQ